MEYRILGKTGLNVSQIGAGTWPIGGAFYNLGMEAGWSKTNDQDSLAALIYALEHGVNIIDTADVYGLGHAERLIGQALKETTVSRENITLVTKVGYFQGCAPHGFDPLNMRNQLKMSMQNMGVDHIDIYFFHHLDFGSNDEYFEPAIAQMNEFKNKGLIKFIGLRGPHTFSLLRKLGKSDPTFDNKIVRFHNLVELIKPDVISAHYNMISQDYDHPEQDLFAWAEQHNLGVLIYKALGQGILLNKWGPDNPPNFSDKDHRSQKNLFSYASIKMINTRLDELGKRLNCQSTKDYVHLALKYCLARYDQNCVFAGFKNKKQVQEILSLQGKLSEDEVEYIRQLFQDIVRLKTYL